MPRGNPQTNRNAYIGKLLSTKRLSFAVIAEMLGVTRNVVAGVAFRRAHPIATLIGNRNKTGTGWRMKTYYPEKTAQNTR